MNADGRTRRNCRSLTGVVHRRGFTLVELLVVIAIIALLLSILMPALQNARNQAKQLACKAGMKQMGVAMAMYVNMYNAYPPRNLQPIVLPTASDWSTDLWFSYYGGYYITWETMLIKSGCFPSNGPNPTTNTLIKIWLCPSQKNTKLMPSPPWHNYGLNSMFAEQMRPGQTGWCTGLIRQDSDKVLIAEVDPYYQNPPRYYLVAPYVDPTLIYYRHRGRSNVLFIDGHVGQVDKKTPGIDNQYGNIWNVRKDTPYR
jgi:prepilin-type N-terminal cleavage/methylation domain-containing protein/prepilin-type processing-associated H-X9-DG protein